MSIAIAETIKAAVAANRGPEENTVILFQEARTGISPAKAKAFLLDEDDEDDDPFEETPPAAYSFAALYVGGQWYLTGVAASSARTMKHRDFMERLASDRVVSAQVATNWEVAK